MNRKGFTLVELLVVVVILAILASVVVGVVGKFGSTSNKPFQGEVIDKWTDFDYDNDKIYRIRTRSPSGEVDTWNSYWVHDKVQIGQSYEFSVSFGNPTEARHLLLESPKQ